MKRTSKTLISCFATALLATSAVAGKQSLVVTDATSIFPGTDTGAVYRINPDGSIDTIASGAPLSSPSGILATKVDGKQAFFVSDIGAFFGTGDGAVHLVQEGEATVTVLSGAPLDNPFGMVIKKNTLYVSDFGAPSAATDGVVYALDLDPDHDGDLGPFPLSGGAGDVTVVFSGSPLNGPNQMVFGGGHELLLADDSGSLYQLKLPKDPGTATSAPLSAFGPGFGDPVGLGRDGKDLIVADATTQEVYRLDKKGEQLTLMLGGSSGDQFLGLAVGKKGVIAVANARSLFSSAMDGEIIRLDKSSVAILYSGPPLVNPFSGVFVKAPKD